MSEKTLSEHAESSVKKGMKHKTRGTQPAQTAAKSEGFESWTFDDVYEAVEYGNAKLAEYGLAGSHALVITGRCARLLDVRGKVMIEEPIGNSNPFLATQVVLERLEVSLRRFFCPVDEEPER